MNRADVDGALKDAQTALWKAEAQALGEDEATAAVELIDLALDALDEWSAFKKKRADRITG